MKRSVCMIVAEISANHKGKIGRALSLIRRAKECGADAVKFQTYTPDTLTLKSDRRYFRILHPKWGDQTLYELYEKAYTPWSWFRTLKREADKLGIIFFSTAFDKTAVDFLERLRVPFHKIASFELVDLELIGYAASKGKPLILSTGMASPGEIRDAIRAARKAGAKDITLLKCVSSYPAEPEEMNINTIQDMKKRFGCAVGLSDHTLGIGASVAAVVKGATMIEKHFTASRSISTPDSFFSMEPKELKDLVDNIRIAEKSLGSVHYGLTKAEKKSKIFRRSLFAVKDIRKGEKFTYKNIRSIRPGYGLAPKYIKDIIGKSSRKAVMKETPLKRGAAGINRKGA